MVRPLFLAALFAIGSSTDPHAQSPLVGAWKVIYPAGAQVENGVQSPIFGSGKLRVEARGDSLVGEFTADPTPELPTRPPVRVAGLAGPMPVALVARQMTAVEVNGVQQLIGFTSTWKLEVKGDSLTGTLSHKVDDPTLSAQEPGPVRGQRQRP